ncbi:MAG: hypothetical protein QGF59_12120 [Pirellulaceae bacterium]|nr:hypothetical protein [Pirellulaceae bacterium]
MIEEVIVWLVLIIGWASLLCIGGVIADAIEKRLRDRDLVRDFDDAVSTWSKTNGRRSDGNTHHIRKRMVLATRRRKPVGRTGHS